MEANRPDPVDVNQFALGQSKISVMSEVCGPIATTPDGLNSFDLYKLFYAWTRSSLIGIGIARHRTQRAVWTKTIVTARTRGAQCALLFLPVERCIILHVAEFTPCVNATVL
jgi:hypothetical protein